MYDNEITLCYTCSYNITMLMKQNPLWLVLINELGILTGCRAQHKYHTPIDLLSFNYDMLGNKDYPTPPEDGKDSTEIVGVCVHWVSGLCSMESREQPDSRVYTQVPH